MPNPNIKDFNGLFRDYARVDMTNVGQLNAQGVTNNIVAKSGAYTATNADDAIACTASSAYQITLPQGAAYAGKIFAVVKDAGANVITVAGASGTIGGAASVSLAANAVHGVTVQSDGTNYWILSQY